MNVDRRLSAPGDRMSFTIGVCFMKPLSSGSMLRRRSRGVAPTRPPNERSDARAAWPGDSAVPGETGGPWPRPVLLRLVWICRKLLVLLVRWCSAGLTARLGGRRPGPPSDSLTDRAAAAV